MTGMSDYSGKNWLAYIVGKTAMPALPTVSIGLFTTAPTDDTGTGSVEVSGNAYARVTTSGTNWNAATGISGSNPTEVPDSISNNAALTFPTATGSWGTVIAYGAFDASTLGNLLFWDYLGNFSWLPCTVSSASPGVITAHAHGFSAADNVIFTTEYGGTIPTFSQSNFTGTLAVVGPTTDTFTVTNAATAVNTSSTGNGMIRKIVPQSVVNGVQVSFAGGTPGALVVTAA